MKKALCVRLVVVAIFSFIWCSQVCVSSENQFIDFIGNIARISSKKPLADNEAKDICEIVSKLIDDVYAAFDQGAFTKYPQCRKLFDEIFKKINYNQWPTPADLREWKNDFKRVKSFFIKIYFFSKNTNSNTVDLDRLAIEKFLRLYSFLIRNIFTEKFMDFSALELFVDTVFVQPIEFTCDHPYIVIGGCSLIGAITYSGYCFMQSTFEKNAIMRLIEKNKSKFIGVQSSEEISTTTWSLFRKWCLQKAHGNMDNYEKLASDDKIYDSFKANVDAFLKKQ